MKPGRTFWNLAPAIVMLIGLVFVPSAAAAGSWRATGSMLFEHFNSTRILLADGRVMAVAGLDGRAKTIDVVEVYDPDTSTWAHTGSLTVPRSRNITVRLDDGRVLVAGGRDDFSSLATAELYDPNTGTWSATGSMAEARDNFRAVKLSDGRVLATGGISAEEIGPWSEHSAEIYDPETETWSPTDHMNNVRWNHELVLLADGRVLATGGFVPGSYTSLRTAEIFDPASGRWEMVSPMRSPRANHLAALLSSGEVLVAGGWRHGLTPSDGAEIFNPATGRWRQVQSMIHQRGFMPWAALPDGRLLVAGGLTADRVRLAAAEIFDPTTETWSPTAPKLYAGSSALVALLDGTVLAPGGAAGNARASEVYLP